MSANHTRASASATTEHSEWDLVITRVFDAPRDLVFKAWTETKHIAQWWGPNGFTIPVCEWDVRPGGLIRIHMRAPNGIVYPMTGVFEEIIAPERLVFVGSALDENGNSMFDVLNTITFAEQQGKTSLTLQARVVKTTALAPQYLKGMEAGWTQSLDRLGALLGALKDKGADQEKEKVKEKEPLVMRSPASNVAQLAGDREIVATRLFDAPRDLVWQAWTDPTHISQWWGPRGFTTTTHEMNLRKDGSWRFVMHGPDGRDYHNRITYVEVLKPERLAYEHAPENSNDEPVNFEVTVRFAAEGEKTRVHMRMLFPSAAARDHVVKTYGAVDGLTQTLGRLQEHLANRGAGPKQE
jgi:uncharacterized protein YndB with AHSA1/START domain